MNMNKQPPHASVPPLPKGSACSGFVCVMWVGAGVGGHLAAVWWLRRLLSHTAQRTFPVTVLTPVELWPSHPVAHSDCVLSPQLFQAVQILAGCPQQLPQNCRAVGHLQCRSLYIAIELQEGERGRQRDEDEGRQRRSVNEILQLKMCWKLSTMQLCKLVSCAKSSLYK